MIDTRGSTARDEAAGRAEFANTAFANTALGLSSFLCVNKASVIFIDLRSLSRLRSPGPRSIAFQGGQLGAQVAIDVEMILYSIHGSNVGAKRIPKVT